jgi:hypothetical protein
MQDFGPDVTSYKVPEAQYQFLPCPEKLQHDESMMGQSSYSK